jgi:hypothetical protein
LNRIGVNPVAGIAKEAETISPSPWGEGRGEGEQNNITQNLSISTRRA